MAAQLDKYINREIVNMVPQIVVTGANICQSLVPFIAVFAYLPQWIKLYRSRSSEGVSLRAWLTWEISSLFAVFYAIVQLALNGRGWPLVFSSSISALTVLVTIILIIWTRRNE